MVLNSLDDSSLESAGFEDFECKVGKSTVVQCGAVWCNVVQCGAVWCSVVHACLLTYCTRCWQKKLLREALEWKTQISFDRFVQHVEKVILHIGI